MMTDDRLDELAALAEAATPGPWGEQALGSEGYSVTAERSRAEAHAKRKLRRIWVARCGWEEWETDKANAAFIAAARQAVPELVAEVRRLREGINALADQMEPSVKGTPTDCKDTCWHGPCTCSGNFRTLSWSGLTPAALRALTGSPEEADE